jgi:hypothetical protein
MRQIITATMNAEEVRMHRCTECWSSVSNWGNGFVPVTMPVIHDRKCSQLKGWAGSRADSTVGVTRIIKGNGIFARQGWLVVE